MDDRPSKKAYRDKTKTNEKKSNYNPAESGIRTNDLRVQAFYNRIGLRPTTTMMDTNEYSPVSTEESVMILVM